MKKITSFILALTVLFTLSVTAAAASVNVSNELNEVRKYYTEQKELSLWEETLTLASTGMLTGKTVFIPESDGSAKMLALRILTQTATDRIPENDGQPKELKNLQKEDGSFGDTATQALAMLALTARKEVYNSQKAYTYLLAQQAENGSFSDSPKDTALAICVLSFSQNEPEKQASAAAVKYLNSYKATNAVDLAWQMIGLTDGGVDAATAGDRNLLENLLSYQNETDKTFYKSHNDTATSPEATALALAALDAVNRDSGMLKRLAANGNLSLYSPEDARPLIIFGAVMLAVGIGFWVYIFLHKKSTKTLEETKTY